MNRLQDTLLAFGHGMAFAAAELAAAREPPVPTGRRRAVTAAASRLTSDHRAQSRTGRTGTA